MLQLCFISFLFPCFCFITSYDFMRSTDVPSVTTETRTQKLNSQTIVAVLYENLYSIHLIYEDTYTWQTSIR